MFDLTDDIIDVRDIIARVKELEDARGELITGPNGSYYVPGLDADDACELSGLTDILDDIAGNGGDEKWRGAWYPVTLVRDSYFVEYTKNLMEDCGTLPKEFPSWIEIDWYRTARNVLLDYTGTEIEGVPYWYR